MYTTAKKYSYMEMIADGPQVPQFAVEHMWMLPWIDRMRVIELVAEAQRLPDSAVFFLDLDLFALNVGKLTKGMKQE